MAVFDPRDTDADPEMIDMSVDAFYGVAGQLTGRTGELEGAFNGAAMNFSDLVAEHISRQRRYNAEDWRGSVEAAVYGAGVTKGWAGDVRDFKRRRQALIGRWEDARAADFGVQRIEPRPEFAPLDPAERMERETEFAEDFARRRAAAEASLLRELNGEANALWEELQSKAGLRGRQLTQGPTPQNLRHLVEHGMLGWAPYNIRGAEAPLPLDPEAGALDAEALRSYLDGDLPPDAGYAAIIAALTAAMRQGAARERDGERLDPAVLGYLEGFYGELGDDVLLMVPGFVTAGTGLGGRPRLRDDTLRAVGSGLLMLSNERLGGGYDRLPATVRNLFKGNVVADGGAMTPHEGWGQDYTALAALLGEADPGLTGGERFSTELIAVTPHYLDVVTSHANRFESDTRLTDAAAAAILGVATRNEEANHAILTGDYDPGTIGEATPELLRSLYTHDWSDDGRAAAGLTEWIHRDGVDEDLAGEAAAALIDTVTDTGGIYASLTDTGVGGKDSMGMVNPELSRGFAKIGITYLDDFARLQDDPDRTAYGSGNLEVAYGDRARFFELIAGDEGAARHLIAGVEAYEHHGLNGYVTDPGQDGASRFGGANARLRAYLDAGLLNEAMDRTGNRHDAAMDAQLREVNGKTFASGFIKETVGNVPVFGSIAKALIGVGKEAYRYDFRGAIATPGMEIQLPNGQQQYSRAGLTRETMLTVIDAAVRDGRIELDDVPEVLRGEGGADRPIRRLDEVPGSELDRAEDAARALLDESVPGFRDLLEVQEREYADVFHANAATNPDHYKQYVRQGRTMNYWK
ncbi:hypothetical protein [Actinomadura sp. 21ATH]|uniref:TPR repeat region-containing protein n=1 Tax=Actinomadura sp. 21ATH TaxID=1735444 RepID=UPI0035C218D2